MDDRYDISYIDDIAVLRVQKALPLAEMLETLTEIAAQITASKRMWVADDHFLFNDEEIRAIAAHSKTLWTEDSVVAYVAYDDTSFNLLRMLEIWREDEHYRIKVCNDMSSALDWLRGWDAAAGSA
ncbi:MAG: hypothetical protein HKN56_03330 [Gammaproteobacteria bacterium]|nr:hypothetical protein [Gammaproteobacteria bacterium]